MSTIIKTPNPNWKNGLIKSMRNPKAIVAANHHITVIRDLYPKAEVHYLVLPNKDIENLEVLNRNHIELLKYMLESAKHIVQREYQKRNFLFGYHAEPTMSRLHMHIISDDFNSEFMKTKRHWNSFTTDFFLKPEDVIFTLQKYGKVSVLMPEQCERYLKAHLTCHKCVYTPKDMAELKQHILIHKKSGF